MIDKLWLLVNVMFINILVLNYVWFPILSDYYNVTLVTIKNEKFDLKIILPLNEMKFGI